MSKNLKFLNVCLDSNEQMLLKDGIMLVVTSGTMLLQPILKGKKKRSQSLLLLRFISSSYNEHNTDALGLNWVSYSYSLCCRRKKCLSASLGMKFCLKTVNHSVFCCLTLLFCLFACLKLCVDLRGLFQLK